MRAARWSLEDREPEAAMAWLKGLPQGAARRTLALRMRLKALAPGRPDRARRWRRRACWPSTGPFRRWPRRASCADWRSTCSTAPRRGAAAARLGLAGAGRAPDARVAIHAAQRLAALRGDAAPGARLAAAGVGAAGRAGRRAAGEAGGRAGGRAGQRWTAPGWRASKRRRRRNPRDATLQYLAGMACMKRQLWGKAQQLLTPGGAGPAVTRNCIAMPGARWRCWPRNAVTTKRRRWRGNARPATRER